MLDFLLKATLECLLKGCLTTAAASMLSRLSVAVAVAASETVITGGAEAAEAATWIALSLRLLSSGTEDKLGAKLEFTLFCLTMAAAEESDERGRFEGPLEVLKYC